MISIEGKDFDIIIVTAEYWDDHPFSPAGVIARVLDDAGYSVGIIEKPETKSDFTKLGQPRLFFSVTSGSIDSMLNNYTPLKHKREDDKHARMNTMPDRAVIRYCNELRKSYKETIYAIGGVEASLRRFAHYDYWDNKLRRSILFDARADILIYGNGELQVVELADRLSNIRTESENRTEEENEAIKGIEGTCVISRELPEDFERLPSFQEVSERKEEFARMQSLFNIEHNLAQEYTNNYLLQYSYPKYTTEDLDRIYELPFSREMHPESRLKMARFSVTTHRGCLGNCNFCSIVYHQGRRMISRSEESILKEIKTLTENKAWRGIIDDLGGPSANMYGMDCNIECDNDCMKCSTLDTSHKRIIDLLKKARNIPGVKNVFVRSGIRYDMAVDSEEYMLELIKHHISGTLKIAPEHFSKKVLNLMNKDNSRFDEFVKMFERQNSKKDQALRYYFMICHPGDNLEELKYLTSRIKEMENTEQFQLFTPTPMTVSTCMYWTGIDPRTMEQIEVVYDYNTKKRMKRNMLKAIGSW